MGVPAASFVFVDAHLPPIDGARPLAEEGFRTFLGCMEETSICIAASAAVSPLAEWADLDGCLLLADDPVTGLEIGPDKRWRLADRPGLGLRLRADARP